MTTFTGSASEAEQRRLYLEWHVIFQLTNWEFQAGVNFTLFSSPEEMESAYLEPDSRLVGGVVLDFSNYPTFVSSDLRMSTEYLPSPINESKPSLFIPDASAIFGGAKAFYNSGFSWLQLRVDSALAIAVAKHTMLDLPNICNPEITEYAPELCNSTLQEPTTWGAVPSNLTTPFNDSLLNSTEPLFNDTLDSNSSSSTFTFPLMMNLSAAAWPQSNLSTAFFLVIIPACLSWVFLGAVYLTVFDMVGDRVSKLKEYLKIMGMTELSYWASNVARMLFLMLPILFILSVVIMSAGFFGSASTTALGLLVLFLFTLNTIAFALLVAAVSPSTSIATFVTIFYFFIPLVATFLINISSVARYFMAFIAPFNFQWAVIQLIKRKVVEELGAVRELPTAINAISDYSIGGSIAFLLVDTFLYGFLAWYFSEILGGTDDLGGSPKPWNFIFSLSYWKELLPSRRSMGPVDSIEFATFASEGGSRSPYVSSLPDRDPACFEPTQGDEDSLRLRIRGLAKRYSGADVNAVNRLDLDIFQGIFVLLGENGSGKSTTISMLSGLIPFTSGSAHIDGKELSTQLDAIRDSISICPQHDLLSNRLTGAEHLRLFGILKGVPSYLLESRIVESLHDVGLASAGDQLVEGYSGGMKRSLSLAISLIAKSRVVFIDEASSGMDMEKRRSLWEMLLRKKEEGSTLVLTTHYMEEAEMLGDRIGIMYRGNLVREGSVAFLKRELGYQIHTSKFDAATHSSSANVELLSLERRDELPARLRALEEEFEQVAVTTPNLEDVFIQIGKSLDQASLSAPDAKKQADPISTLSMNALRPATRAQQVIEYWRKRGRADSRHLANLLCFILIPVIITIIAMTFTVAFTSMMSDFPKKLQAARATQDTVSLTFVPPTSKLEIPYVSVDRQSLLDAWEQSSNNVAFKFLGDPNNGTVLTRYLWNGTDSAMARLGGCAVLGNYTTEYDPSVLWDADARVQVLTTGITVSYNITSGDTDNSTTPTYLVGIEYNQTNVYSLVGLTNFINNAIAADYLNRTSHSLSSPFIRTRSVPFASKTVDDGKTTMFLLAFAMSVFNTQFAFLLSLAFAILGGQIGKQITDEMEKQIVPQLQRIGFASSTFWFANLLFNAARITTSALLTMIVVALFREDLYSGTSFLPFAISLLLQSWTTVVLAAIISNLFSEPATAQKFIHLILCLMAMLPSAMQLMLSAIATTMDNPQDNIFWDLAKVAPLLSPLSVLVSVVKEICWAYMIDWETPTASTLFAFSKAGKPIMIQFIYFGASIVGFAGMEIYKSRIRTKNIKEPVEYHRLAPATSHTSVLQSDDDQSSRRDSMSSVSSISSFSSNFSGISSVMAPRNDEDVVALSDEEAQMDASVRLDRLWKRFPGLPRRSVAGTSLVVPRGMCFGLLGPNGAGKSTTISMLIGDLSPSGGSYSLDGFEAIGTNKNDLYQHVRLACCLQIDSLYDDMTVMEHLELFLRVRNNANDLNLGTIIHEILVAMKLLPHAQKLASQLSGGNKRKLCTALAALTGNNIIVLDEPSAGCDPSMRRTLWGVLKIVQDHNKALILTTHSMDEADACCNRIGIMVNGQIASLGSPQALKAQCGGYELQIVLPPLIPTPFGQGPPPTHDDDMHALEDEVLKPNFPALALVDRDVSHDGSLVLKYDIGAVSSVASAFEILHSAFKQGRFVDYSLSQVTLGTAYQRLVRQQQSDHQ